ncbi:MAG TPA: hypothetical protein DCQ31_17905 [Bacteroidales bacterium]|nr:hypothetical protein [Bacteroidales bacterium]
MKLFEKVKNQFNKQSNITDSNGIMFNFMNLPKQNRKDNVYICCWLIQNGDWINENEPLYLIRVGEKSVSGHILKSQPLKAQYSGIIEILVQEDEQITSEKQIYKVYQIGEYLNENSKYKAQFMFYFNGYKCQYFQDNYKHRMQIKQWYYNDGDFVNENDVVISFGFADFNLRDKELYYHRAEKTGFLEIKSHSIMSVRQKEHIYTINEDDTKRTENLFRNFPKIEKDNFDGKLNIKWGCVAGSNFGGIVSYDLSNKISLCLSFNYINNEDRIIFQFYSNQLKIKKGDSISFLFQNKNVIHFELNSKPIIAKDYNNKTIFEFREVITQDELKIFEEQDFDSWKIAFLSEQNEIIGGLVGYGKYEVKNNLNIALKKLTKDYKQLINKEIENYQPILKRENIITEVKSQSNNEECHVYLMVDTTNGYYKIGISNKPEYREKTLQSEKPTIELIIAKKFPTRLIAESIEKALHNSFENKRLRGEWFNLPPKDVNDIINSLK